MASISKLANGRRAIQFVGPDRKRRTVRLGKMSQRNAESVKVRVERLAASASTGHPVDDDTARWVSALDEVMHKRLAKVGLVPDRTSSLLLCFVDEYIAKRGDVKTSTATVWRRARNHIEKFFGPDQHIRDVTVGQAKDFRRHLLKQLAEDTVRRTCGITKQFFEDALDRGLISRNPFKHRDIPTATGAGDKSREFFVSTELTEKVLNSLPNAQWRLMFALARYGGMRCPSEVLSLRWRDVDWETGKLTVTSPKTEHHDGGDSRLVPLFPELRPYLQDCFELAEDGTEYVVTQYRKMDTSYSTLLKKKLRAAGLPTWPKPWQNLRSTRETELVERFPIHVVCAWIGNSQVVAQKHYLQGAEDHFSKAVQNPVQQIAETPRDDSQGVLGEDQKSLVLQGVASDCDFSQETLMGDEGLETMAPDTRKIDGPVLVVARVVAMGALVPAESSIQRRPVP